MFNQPSSFQASISRPVEQGNFIGADRLRKLLGAICIRRNLPEPEEVTEYVDSTPEEAAEYSRIGLLYRQSIDDVVSGISQSNEYSGLFQTILQLRIFCNHGTFTCDSPRTSPTTSSTDETFTLLQQNDQAICAHCSCDVTSIGEDENGQTGVFTLCSHLLCQGCVQENKLGSNK